MDELIAFPMAQRQLNIQQAVQNYGKRLFSFIRRRVKNDQDAEDILQDVWYQLTSIIDTEPIGQLGSWLYRVSRNRIVDKKRKQKPQSLEDLSYEDEEGETIFPGIMFAESMNAETEIENAFFWESFSAALSELPGKQREAFVWNELDGLTLQQIADKTGESIKTIISRKHYAVVHLRELLQNIYENY